MLCGTAVPLTRGRRRWAQAVPKQGGLEKSFLTAKDVKLRHQVPGEAAEWPSPEVCQRGAGQWQQL